MATPRDGTRRIYEVAVADSKNQALWYNLVVDREAEARAIVVAARAGRKPLPRWLWIVALATSAICVTGLAIAWFAEADTVADKPLQARSAAHSSGLGFGLLVGLGLGIAIGSVIALRKRKS